MNDPREKDEQLSEALNAAYPSNQPGEQLHGRMVEAERAQRLQSYRPRSGWKKGWLMLVGGLALLSVLGFTAYNYFFNRPGEAAIALVPADADFVVTLDTNPSTRQIATFHKIGQALEKEGILEKLDDTLTQILNQNPVAKRIRPYVSKNMALAVWMPSGGFEKGPEPDGAFFLALTDAGEVDSILSESIPNDNSKGFRIYNVDKRVFGAVIGNYLVVGPNADILVKISNVHSGNAQSVAQLPEYKKARASLAEDSNLMMFMSPDALAMMEQAGGPNPFAGMKWMAMGMALRDAGLEFTYQMPLSQDRMPGLKHLADIAPVDPAVLRRLPTGAYGVIAYSQTGKYWDFFKETAGQDRHVKEEMTKGLAEFEKETGISIDREVIPAFGGNMLLAVYPSPTMGADSADGILVLDDAHGANPAALADKVRVLIEKGAAKDGKEVKFISTQQGNATIWRLDPNSRRELQEGMASGNRHDEEAMVTPGEWDEDGMAAPDALPEPPVKRGPVEVPPALADKTIIYAQVGNSVIIASSEAMMTKALQAYDGRGSTLADDPAFAGMQTMHDERSQSLTMVSIHRILSTLRPKLEQQMQNAPISVDDLINLFGGPGTGLVADGWYDGELAVGEMFIPLDYERLVHIIGSGMRHDEKRKAQDAQFSMRDAPKLAPAAMRTAKVLAHL